MTIRQLVLCTLLSSLMSMSPLGISKVQAYESLASPIVIGEIAWAGSSLSTADEWIELWNLSDSPLSIAGWSLVGAGENEKDIVFPSDATIPAYGTYLVSNYKSTDVKSAFKTLDSLVTTVISLSNSNQNIELRDAVGNTVDVAGDGSVPFAGVSLPVKTSMIRIEINAPGSTSESWADSISAQNLKSEITDLGTPGFCDLCFLNETQESTAQEAPVTLDGISSTTTLETLPETVYEPSQIQSEVPTGTSSEASSIPAVATEPAPAPLQSVSPKQNAENATTETSENESATASSTILDGTGVLETAEPSSVETTSTEQAAYESTNSSDQTVPTANTASTSEETTHPAPEQEIETAITVKPAYAMLRLNEIMPNPASGKEWVEIVSLDSGNNVPLLGCMLYDAQGKIITISDITLNPVTNTHVVIELSSARLNNAGDNVALYDPNGQLIDTMNFADSEKGSPFIRYPDKNGDWQSSSSPTPAKVNLLTQEINNTTTETNNNSTQTTTETSLQSASQTEQSSVTAVASLTNSATATSTVTKTTSPKTNSKTTVVPPLTAAQIKVLNNLSKKSATSTAQIKTTTPKKSTIKLILPIGFDMRLSDEYGGVQVQLRGTVGTPPGLLTGNAFVLLAPDGQGIKVAIPTSKILPAFGSSLAVTGVLRFNNLGYPSLQMGAKDKWTVLASSPQNVSPRLVDLISPNADDAWSLISVTGTVKQVKDQTVILDLGDMEISMIIRPPVDYRAKRLIQGDIVTVKGVLEFSSQNDPRILPRSSDEIVLVSHAEPKQTAMNQTSTSVPNWLPLGAAAGAVVITEGAKKMHRRRKRQLLEKKVAELSIMEN